MHEGAASITTLAKTVAWGVALAIVVGFHVGPRPARAQDGTPRQPRVDYNAPADCPSRAEFERRLDARLRASPSREQAAARFSVTLERHGDHYRGAMTMSSRGGVVGQRTIEASRCSEAVDALAFVAALLVDDRARALAPQADPAQAKPSPPSGRPREARRAGSTRSSAETNAGPGDSSTSQAATSPAEAPPDAAPPVRASAPNAQPGEPALPSPGETVPRDVPTRAPAAVEPVRADTSAELPEAGTPWRLGGGFGVAALLVSGVAPALRPGLELRATGYALRGRVSALAAAIGGRATLPHDELSPEGTGRFGWWSVVFTLCAGVHGRADRVAAALCLTSEGGQVVAQGRATEDARGRRARWLAIGPALQLGVRLAGPVWLSPGFELLWPSTRDRFVVGATELYEVPWLTFRAQLAVAVRWP